MFFISFMNKIHINLISYVLDIFTSNVGIYSFIFTYYLLKYTSNTNIYCFGCLLFFIFILTVIKLKPQHVNHSNTNVSTLIETSFVKKPDIYYLEKHRNKQHIYIFSPHGHFPITMFWLFQQPQFQNTYLLVASQLHKWWLSKLLFMWSGRILEITPENIEWCLQNGYSVMLSLGGITEMLLKKPSHLCETDFFLYSGHKKIFTIANKYNIPIVPILCDGQQNLHYNPIVSLTRFIYHNTGYPIPFCFTNKYGFPMSNRIPLTVLIGKEIKNPTKEKLYSYYETNVVKKYLSFRKIEYISKKI